MSSSKPSQRSLSLALLPVAVQDHQCVNIHLSRVFEQRLERATVASVHAMSDDGRAAGFGDSGAGVGRSVIDADDFINVLQSTHHDGTDGLLFVEDRHPRNDAGPLRGGLVHKKWARAVLFSPYRSAYVWMWWTSPLPQQGDAGRANGRLVLTRCGLNRSVD